MLPLLAGIKDKRSHNYYSSFFNVFLHSVFCYFTCTKLPYPELLLMSLFYNLAMTNDDEMMGESVTVALTFHNDEFVVVQLNGLSGCCARVSSVNKSKSDKNVRHCDKSAVLGPFFLLFFPCFLSCHWPGKTPNEGRWCRALSW